MICTEKELKEFWNWIWFSELWSATKKRKQTANRT